MPVPAAPSRTARRAATVTACAALAAAGVAHADVLASFDFNDSGNRTLSTDADANSSASLTAGAGFTVLYENGNGSDRLVAEDPQVFGLDSGSTADRLAGALAGGDYVDVTLTPDSQRKLTFESLSFTYAERTSGTASGDYTLYLELRSGIDNFADPILTSFNGAAATANGNSTTHTARQALATFTGASFTDLAGPVTFRIVMADNRANAATTLTGVTLDNIVINGTNSAIPEPSAAALLALGGLAALARRRTHA